MEHLIIHPNSILSWQALVQEASQSCKINLTEDLESYLVFVLMKFTQNNYLSTDIIATELLGAAHKIGESRHRSLKNVGDKCLIFSGLFPGIAHKRLVKISYYVQLGKTAYSTLAIEDQDKSSNIFHNLDTYFVPLMDIMHAMREVNDNNGIIDPIAAAELWQDTGSQHALETLKKFTNNELNSSFIDNLWKIS